MGGDELGEWDNWARNQLMSSGSDLLGKFSSLQVLSTSVELAFFFLLKMMEMEKRERERKREKENNCHSLPKFENCK